MPAQMREGETLKISLVDIEGPAFSKMQSRVGQKPRDCILIPNTFPMLSGASPILVLPHTPKRQRSNLFISSPGTVALGQTSSEVAAALNAASAEYIGAAFFATGPVLLDIRGTTELWAGLYASNAPATNPVPSQPAVPASGVAQQNVNSYPVNVTLSGFTLTAVTVNGITVGAANGLYVVPAYGAIAVTYSVAGTWTWANANSQAVGSTTWVSVIKEIAQ